MIDGMQLKEKLETTTKVTEDNGVFSNTTDVKRVRSIKGGGKIWKQEGTSSSCKEVTQTLRGVHIPYGDFYTGMVQEEAWTTETSLSQPELAEFEEIWKKMWHPKVAVFATVSFNKAPQKAQPTHEKSRMEPEHEEKKKRFWCCC